MPFRNKEWLVQRDDDADIRQQSNVSPTDKPPEVMGCPSE